MVRLISKLTNADMDSRGIEVLLGGEILRIKTGAGKKYFDFGYNTTKITNAKDLPNIFSLVGAEGGNKEGYPVRSLFSIKYNGLEPFTGIPTFVDEGGKTSTTVYMQSQSTDNLQYEGPVDPTITGGFSNTFYCKAFSLNVFVTYQAGNTIRMYPAFLAPAIPTWMPCQENFTIAGLCPVMKSIPMFLQ